MRASSTPAQKVGYAIVGGLLVLAMVFVWIAQGRREGADPDQAWFWEPEWLGGELQAQQEVAAGAGTTYQSTEEFLSHLDDVPPRPV